MLAILSPARQAVARLRKWRADRREAAELARQIGEWHTLAAELTEQWSGTAERLLIFPSDPWTLIGAVGDDAMISATIGFIRARNPDAQVRVATASDHAEAMCRTKGWEPIRLWREPFSMAHAVAAFRDYRPTVTAALGADVMDGYYSPFISMQLLALSDLAARLGAHATLLGFSFNRSPHPALAPLFGQLHPRVQINLRDEISFERFRTFTHAEARLTADSAFLLEPADLGFAADALAWADAERAAGRIVLGFNIHPMLFPNATQAQVDAIIAAAVAGLREVAAARPVSFVMTPHDYRGTDGDARCLRTIADALASDDNVRVHYLDGQHSAAQLKAFAGSLDGVVAARMHLLIATLGSGRPVAAVTYQDKFAGLYRHFGIADSLMLSPADLIAGGRLAPMIIELADRIAEETERVQRLLPGVRELSAQNFPQALQP